MHILQALAKAFMGLAGQEVWWRWVAFNLQERRVDINPSMAIEPSMAVDFFIK